MEFMTALAELKGECRCPICLDYLNNPVTINCGHNFCFDCLNLCWKDLTDFFPCPFCRFSFTQRKFRKNPQLSNLTEIAKQLQIRTSKRKRQEENAVCEKHNRFITLFCVKDLQIVCTQCSFSAEHQGHYMCSINKAATYHRNILASSIEPWQDNVELVEKVLILQGRKSCELKKKVEDRREEINSEFEQIKLFLQNEREEALKQIQDEKVDILSKLNENLVAFSGHVSTLKHLLKEIEVNCRQSDLVLLKHVKSIRQRYHNLTDPELFSFVLNKYGLSLPPLYSGLERIIQQFQTDVSFDRDTAYPQLIVSEDRKSVKYVRTKKIVRYNSRRFYLCPAVLGSEIFNSGRHYWEVDVGNKLQWTLGVCQQYLPRNWRNQPSVLRGFWAIGRYVESGYVVFGPKKTQLLPVPKPSKVGIFLDYDLGEVSFYNVDERSLLYSFSDSFTKAICPYFYVGTDSEPLKILSVDGER